MKEKGNFPVNLTCELMTTRQAAQYLKISPKTLEKMRLEGGGPRYFKIGRVVRYSPDELEKFLRQNSYSNTSEYSRK
jgi:excisionase family DNA binding protein